MEISPKQDSRLDLTSRYKILNQLSEAALTDIALLAAEICEVPLVLIDLLGDTRAWFNPGVNSPIQADVCHLSWEGFAVRDPYYLGVINTLEDKRFAQKPWVVGGPKISSYSGTPLIAEDGQVIGTFCVLSAQPQALTLFQKHSVERLAKVIVQFLQSEINGKIHEDSVSTLAFFNHLASIVAEMAGPRNSILKVIQETCNFFRASVGHYFEVNPLEPDKLYSSGIWVMEDSQKFASFKTVTEKIKFVEGVGLPGQVLKKGKPIWYSEINESTEMLRLEICQELGLRSVFSLPVIINNQVVGVFEFFLTGPLVPDENLFRVMEQLDTQMARVFAQSHAEEALDKQREFFDAVLDNMSDGIVACNADGQLVLFNRATRVFHGLDSNRLIPPEQWAQYYQLFDADGKTPLQQERIPLVRAFLGETIRDVEMVVVATDKAPRNLLCSGRALIRKDGKKIGAVVTLHDVTENKKARQELEKTTKTLQAVIDITPVATMIFDNNMNLTLWNPGCESTFGWKREEVLGKPIPFVPEIERARSRAYFEEVITKKDKIEAFTERRHKNGSVIMTRSHLVPMFDDLGAVIGGMAVVIDISEMKRSELVLIETNRALKSASVAKSEFLASMSHEIRTPLNGIIGLTELALRTSLNPEQRKYIETIDSSASSLLTIVSDILDFSKIEAGKLDIENVDFDLRQVFNDVHQILNHSAHRKGIKLSHTVLGDINTLFKGDPGRIRQILMNLVTNAVKFTEKGSVATTVTVSPVNNHQTQVLVQVRDTGLGIPQETLERLFKAFTQADSSTSRKFGGTGLGLSISQRLVELMKGSIGVESEVGRGSTFWFKLNLENSQHANSITSIPQSVAAPEAEQPLASSKRVGEPEPLKVLLAEDNFVNQTISMKMLSILGFKADLAVNGLAVLEALRTKSYDLILMDCSMPEMDGYEASQQIRKLDTSAQGDILIIALTANAMKGDREKCLAAGMNDYLTKPFKLEELRATIARNIKKNTSSS